MTRFPEKALIHQFRIGSGISISAGMSSNPEFIQVNHRTTWLISKLFKSWCCFLFTAWGHLLACLRLRSTKWDHLQKGRFVVKHLWWVPDALGDVTKRARLTMAESLLKNLQQLRNQGCPFRAVQTQIQSSLSTVDDMANISALAVDHISTEDR